MSLILTQLAVDDFQRSNENPLSGGGNWVVDTYGDNPLQIVSDVCEGTQEAENAELYTGVSLPNNQYASVTLAALVTAHDTSFQIMIRVTDTGVSYGSLPGYRLYASPNFGLYYLYSAAVGLILSVSATASAGDVWTVAAIGSTIYVLQNGVQLGSVTNTNYASGLAAALVAQEVEALTDVQFSNFAVGSAALTYSVSGNAGAAAATVAYTGTASGSVTADGSGNFTISGLANGTYTVTPSLLNHSFSPTSRSETVSGANITGVNFTAGLQYAAGYQPAQMFSTDGSGHYCVIDNAPGLADGINYDCTDGGAEFSNIGTNFYPNETMPDFYITAKTFTTTTAGGLVIRYKNPS